MIMIMLSFNHFWGEIVEGAAKSCSLNIWFHEIGPSKICKFESAVAVNKKILRLYVSMNYTLAMQVFERIYKVFDVKSNLLLREFLILGSLQLIPKLTSFTELNDKIYTILIFKMIVEMDYILMVNTIHDLDLSDHLGHHSTLFQLLFIHLLKGICYL